jgi:outer membrane protein assembly factor BamB
METEPKQRRRRTFSDEFRAGAVRLVLEDTVAIVALDATTLSLKGSWQIPPGEASSDSDFGAGATLFDDPSGRALVGAANKDGYFYALDRSTLTEVWESQLDTGGDNPLGSGSISPAAIANACSSSVQGTAPCMPFGRTGGSSGQ